MVYGAFLIYAQKQHTTIGFIKLMDEMKLKRIIKKQKIRVVCFLISLWIMVLAFLYEIGVSYILFIFLGAMLLISAVVMVAMNFIEKSLILKNHAKNSDD